jgi:hypothetical protein
VPGPHPLTRGSKALSVLTPTPSAKARAAWRYSPRSAAPGDPEAVGGLDEDSAMLLYSILATHQALRAIAIFTVGRSDQQPVSRKFGIGSVVLVQVGGHVFRLMRGTWAKAILADSNRVCDRRHGFPSKSHSNALFNHVRSISDAGHITKLQIEPRCILTGLECRGEFTCARSPCSLLASL